MGDRETWKYSWFFGLGDKIDSGGVQNLKVTEGIDLGVVPVI